MSCNPRCVKNDQKVTRSGRRILVGPVKRGGIGGTISCVLVPHPRFVAGRYVVSGECFAMGRANRWQQNTGHLAGCDDSPHSDAHRQLPLPSWRQGQDGLTDVWQKRFPYLDQPPGQFHADRGEKGPPMVV